MHWQHELIYLQRLMGWVAEPTSLVEFLFEKLPEVFEKESDVEKMCSNPNSFFVSLKNVKSVTPNYNFSQGHSITVGTASKSLVVCQDLLVEQREDYFGTMWRIVNPMMYQAGQWHTDVVNSLNSKI
jgi:hypothetical protein